MVRAPAGGVRTLGFRWLVAVLAGAVGVAQASAGPTPLIAGACAACLWTIGLARFWRLGLYSALLYMPFSGVVTAISFPTTVLAPLFRDIALLVPCYVGFVMGTGRAAMGECARRHTLSLVFLVAFASVVVVQMLNPAVPAPLVAVTGAKVWLFTVPLLFLGYEAASDARRLLRLMRLLVAVAIIPSVVALASAVVIYSGNAGLMQAIYGPAWLTMSQNQFATDLGTGALYRIPSTLPSSFQYHVYSSVMAALAFMLWRQERLSGGRGNTPLLALLLIVAGGVVSGSRAAVIMPPLLIALVAALSGEVRALVGIAPIGAMLGASVIVATGNPLDALVSYAAELARDYLRDTFWDPLVALGDRAILGLGTGVDTVAARYAFPDVEEFFALMPFQESWIIKTIMELGVFGAVPLAAFFMGSIGPAAAALARRPTTSGRLLGGALLAVVVWSLVYSLKATYIDFVPLDAYFWFFLGCALRVTDAMADGVT